jgi:hypothetical protein
MGQAAVSCCFAKDKDPLSDEIIKLRKDLMQEVKKELRDEMTGLSTRLEKLAVEKAEQAAAAVAESGVRSGSGLSVTAEEDDDFESMDTESLFEQVWALPVHEHVPKGGAALPFEMPRLRLASLNVPKFNGTPRLAEEPKALDSAGQTLFSASTRLEVCSGRGTQRSDASSCAFYRIYSRSVEAPITTATTARESETEETPRCSPRGQIASPQMIRGGKNCDKNSPRWRSGWTARHWHTPRGEMARATAGALASCRAQTSRLYGDHKKDVDDETLEPRMALAIAAAPAA